MRRMPWMSMRCVAMRCMPWMSMRACERTCVRMRAPVTARLQRLAPLLLAHAEPNGSHATCCTTHIHRLIRSYPLLVSHAEPNDGRGADYAHYSWTQTLGELTVSVPLPAGTKAKMLDVVMRKDSLLVGIKGQAPLLEVWGVDVMQMGSLFVGIKGQAPLLKL